MQFEYTATDKKGQSTSGRLEAENKRIAKKDLKDRGLENIKLESTEESKGLGANIKFLSRVSVKDRVVFSRQLSVMISANVPLLRALRSLIAQTENPALKDIVENLADEIEGGAKLSDAMSLHPDTFSDFYVSMVQSGETTGKLDEVLTYLADEQEKDYELMSKIRGSIIYPAFIIAGLIAVGILMMIFVIPRLTQILIESGAELPLTTRILIFTSDIMAGYWWLMLIIAVAAAIGIRLFIRVPVGRFIWDNLKIRLPLFGGIFKKIYIVRFTRSMNTLITGGVDIVSSLQVVSNVVGNAVYKQLVNQTIREVEDGNSVTVTMEDSDLFPPMVSQMIKVGEETGQMAFVMEKLTDFFSREVRSLVDNLVTIIEPIVMIIMGIAVGVMVSAVLMPMYNLASQY
jgi:type IV pilus assembly protein PilC